jgi:hypothetical protein
MDDFNSEYRHQSDDELLQLWVERAQLTPEAKRALEAEVHKRSLTKEAERATDAWAEPPEPPLAPPVRTYLGLSVPWFCWRELWLRLRTRRGIAVEAKVESALQSRRPIRSAARAELRYSYTYEGQQYLGRTVRDFTFGKRAADALAYGHKPGDVITVRIDPAHPSRSYFPSGFGWIAWLDSFWSGSLAALAAFLWVLVLWRLLRR